MIKNIIRDSINSLLFLDVSSMGKKIGVLIRNGLWVYIFLRDRIQLASLNVILFSQCVSILNPVCLNLIFVHTIF